MIFPPYGDAAGSVIGENPVVSAIEMYVSPYDSWENGWDSRPEQIQFSELSAGKTIGFGVVVNDWDSFGAWDGLWEPDGMPPDERGPGVSSFFYRANRFLDGLLVPASKEQDEISAVEIDSWAGPHKSFAVRALSTGALSVLLWRVRDVEDVAAQIEKSL